MAGRAKRYVFVSGYIGPVEVVVGLYVVMTEVVVSSRVLAAFREFFVHEFSIQNVE